MTALQNLIDKFEFEEDDDARAEIITSEFEFLQDHRKWDFLLPLIETTDTYDLIKVGIYKMIEIADFRPEDLPTLKDRILAALLHETDDDVRKYAYASLTWAFSAFDDVLALCLKTVENKREDMDVRHWAFGVIEKSKNTAVVNTFRERLLAVSEFKTSAGRLYANRT